MSGVEILNIAPYTVGYSPGVNLLFIGLCLFILVLIAGAGIFFWDGDYSEGIAAIIAIVLVSTATGCVFFYGKPIEVDSYYVTVDDSVSFTEFNEKYKIIDIEGKIYHIVEKDKEN